MIVALTGGTGFLGYHLISALLRAGHEVRLLKRPGSSHPLMPRYPPKVHPIDLSFDDTLVLEKALTGCDAIVHGAGVVSYNLGDQQAMWDVHVVLTQRLLEIAKKVGIRRFVHVSSIVTLGHGRELRDERSEYNAQSLKLPYWETKTEGERLALAANAPGFEVVSVNPGSLLGEGEKGAQLLPFVRKLAGSARPVLPDGGSDFVDVADAAVGTVLALEKGRAGERYILGAENLTYAEFHARLRKALGRGASLPRVLPQKLLRVLERILAGFEKVTRISLPVNSLRLRRVNGVYMFHDLAKARRELGYSPALIDSAIRRMLGS